MNILKSSNYMTSVILTSRKETFRCCSVNLWTFSLNDNKKKRYFLNWSGFWIKFIDKIQPKAIIRLQWSTLKAILVARQQWKLYSRCVERIKCGSFEGQYPFDTSFSFFCRNQKWRKTSLLLLTFKGLQQIIFNIFLSSSL